MTFSAVHGALVNGGQNGIIDDRDMARPGAPATDSSEAKSREARQQHNRHCRLFRVLTYDAIGRPRDRTSRIAARIGTNGSGARPFIRCGGHRPSHWEHRVCAARLSDGAWHLSMTLVPTIDPKVRLIALLMAHSAYRLAPGCDVLKVSCPVSDHLCPRQIASFANTLSPRHSARRCPAAF